MKEEHFVWNKILSEHKVLLFCCVLMIITVFSLCRKTKVEFPSHQVLNRREQKQGILQSLSYNKSLVFSIFLPIYIDANASVLASNFVFFFSFEPIF